MPGATYTTLASTLLVLSIFDTTMALLIFAYALTLGVLPGVGSLGSLPGFDFGFFAANPEFSAVLFVVLVIFGCSGSCGRGCTSTSSRRASARGSSCCATAPSTSSTSPLWQAGDWLLRFVAIWFFLGAFGIEQSVRNVLLVQVTQSLATLVPISPGGIGTEQAFIVYVFSGTGIGRATLLAFSVGMKLTLIVTNIILGFTALFLTLGHTDWRSIAGKRTAPEP